MSAPAKLSVEAVSGGYGEVEVLRGLDLAIADGRITALLGPNGAGKSTTCKVVAGAIPVTAGRVLLDGVDITRRPAWWRARHGVSLIPEGRGIFPSLSVDENLAVLLPDVEERNQVYDRFPALADRRRQEAGSLSGGQQQILSLGPTLVHRAELLVVDEPTLGLAPRVAAEVLGIFDELRAGGGTILLAGESPRGLLEVADDVMVLHGGAVTWAGPVDTLDGSVIESSYFGSAGAELPLVGSEGPP